MEPIDFAQSIQHAVATGGTLLAAGLAVAFAAALALAALGSFRRVGGSSATLREGRPTFAPSRSRIALR